MRKKAQTLSIVIPVYNEQRYLSGCLKSIALQSEMPDEVIVVDNNSTDNSASIAKQFSFVKLIHEPRQGIAYARDCGFNAARGNIITRIDSDTNLPRNWVVQIKKFYSNPPNSNCALTGGAYFRNIACPNFVRWWHEQIAFRANKMLLGHYITWGSNMALPRRLWLKVRSGLNHELGVHEDVDLAIHIHKAGYKIIYDSRLTVTVIMRRVLSNRDELMKNMMMWPRTLKANGLKTWPFGLLGAVLLYPLWPLAPIAKKIQLLANWLRRTQYTLLRLLLGGN